MINDCFWSLMMLEHMNMVDAALIRIARFNELGH